MGHITGDIKTACQITVGIPSLNGRHPHIFKTGGNTEFIGYFIGEQQIIDLYIFKPLGMIYTGYPRGNISKTRRIEEYGIFVIGQTAERPR